MRRLALAVVSTLTLAGSAGLAPAQTPGATTQAPQQATQTTPAPTLNTSPATPQRPAQRPQRPNRTQTPTTAATTTPPSGTPPRPGTPQRSTNGAISLDLNSIGRPQSVVQNPGNTFSASGPYATPQQMQRYTGHRPIELPQAPVRLNTGTANPDFQLNVPQ